MRMQVRSLASLSGWRIQLWCRLQTQLRPHIASGCRAAAPLGSLAQNFYIPQCSPKKWEKKKDLSPWQIFQGTYSIAMDRHMLHSSSPEFIHLAWPKVYPCGSAIPHFFLLPQALAITVLFFASMSLTILDTSYKWSHAVFVFLCLA